MPALSPIGDTPLWDCYTTWKPNWNAKSPPNSKPALQQALDDYQPLRDHCRLAMHRHHRYARAIATSYGEVRLQIPVFRCGQCRRMAGGMTLLGDEMRHQRFSKKNRDAAISLAAQGLSYARAGNRAGCVKSTVCKCAEGAFDSAGVAAGRKAGTGRFVDANQPGAYQIEGNLQCCCGMALGAFGPWSEVIDRAWQLGAQHPQHLVSDDDEAIAAGIELVYGGDAPHQLPCFTCCGSTGRTLGRRDLRRRGGC